MAANNAAANDDCGAASSANDTIGFSVSGTITLSSQLPNVVSGQGTLAIDGEGTVTISGNSSVRVLSVDAGGNLTLQSITIANGSVSGNGGGIFNNGTVTIKNSIIASSDSNNCFIQGGSAFNSQGVNFSTDSTCTGFTQKTLAELNLGPLANNGGPTQTHALLAGSHAIDAVSDCTFSGGGNVTQDQRGTIHPQDGSCDIGAFEAMLHSLNVNKTGSARSVTISPL